MTKPGSNAISPTHDQTNITIEWLDDATEQDIAKLDATRINDLTNDLITAEAVLKARKARLTNGIASRYQPPATPGTVYKLDGAFKVKAEVDGKVEWDTPSLMRAASAMEVLTPPLDPYTILDVKLTIAAAIYKGLSAELRKLVDPARTVKAGNPKITIMPAALPSAQPYNPASPWLDGRAVK